MSKIASPTTRQRSRVLRRGIFICLNITVWVGCASIPDGDLQLGPKIVRDMRDSRTSVQALNKGRPVYIEVYSYPQLLETGDIWSGGALLLNLGREDISLDSLIKPAIAPSTSQTNVGEYNEEFKP